jgi:hypothetical protein
MRKMMTMVVVVDYSFSCALMKAGIDVPAGCAHRVCAPELQGFA